jgi:hypothetical protein
MSTHTFDRITQALGSATSRREAIRLLAGATLALFGVACGRDVTAPGVEEEVEECGTASGCGDRQFCSDDQKCICIRSAEGKLRCGRLPPSCGGARQCTTSADCADLGAGYFCDSPKSGCCSETLQYCIAPCAAPPSEETAFALAAANSRDLLFSFRYPGHDTHYYGTKSGDRMEPTHVVFSARNGSTGILIVNEDFLPIQWIMPGASVSVRRGNTSQPLDEQAALHFFATTEQAHTSLNVRLGDLRQVLDRAEALVGQTFPAARAFLLSTTSSPTTLLNRARTAGDDQPRLIAAAIAFRAAASLIAMAGAGPGVQALTAPATGAAALLSPVSGAVNLATTMLTPLLGDILDKQFGPGRPLAPNDPAVHVLLCQGATRMEPICHYVFFINEGRPEPCVSFCKTSMGCFTNICQPMTISARDARNARDRV